MSEVKDYPPYLDYPKPRKKQTNGDRIRAMNDEQLAEMFVRHDAKCYLEGHLDKTGYLIYLQQEASDGSPKD